MKFGIFILGEKTPMLPGDEVYRRNLDQCRAADDMGYDTIWLGEHHFSPYGTIADPFVFGASVAAVTKHARIGTAVVIPAFMNPIRMAERVAMVDAISGGRFDLGLGRGYQQKSSRICSPTKVIRGKESSPAERTSTSSRGQRSRRCRSTSRFCARHQPSTGGYRRATA